MTEKKRQGGLSEALQAAPALQPLGTEDLARVEGGGYYDDVANHPLGAGGGIWDTEPPLHRPPR